MDGKEIGARIKGLRARSGLNQTEFAKRCGVSLNGQSNFERGLNLPGGDYLLKLAEQGADITYILTGVRSVQSPQEAVLLDNYRAACAEQQAQLLEVSRALAGSAGTASKKITNG